jgi:type II secretory pathway pseudopilin PulG
LIELLAVMTIIGILLSLVLVASMDADKQARIQATQALIQKLDTALNDRMDALLQSTPTPNWAHGYLAAIYNQGVMIPPVSIMPEPNSPIVDNPALKTTLRAQAIATYDYIKRELPDVFFIDPNFWNNPGSYGGPYPFNFTGVPYYPNGAQVDPNTTGLTSLMLPLGHMVQGPLILAQQNGGGGNCFGDAFMPTNGPFAGILQSSNPTLGFTGAGIYGASYTAAAGIYKNLGYLPTGYDAVDNNNNGLIDEWGEGVNASNSALVIAHLQNHTHDTARSEMLYAVLVEGTGPYGAAFSRDEFSDKEVQDTDGDGLPEFVDAWGKPLQFFRWPILYHSDYERGQTLAATGGQAWTFAYPYVGALDTREQDTLDLNGQLTAPGWWSTTGIGGLAANNSFPALTPAGPPLPANSGASVGVQTFGAFFHRLTEPMQVAQNTNFFLWDRGGSYRRAFYSKPLILAAGPNGSPGVFLYSDAALKTLGQNAALALIANENNAMQFGLDVADFTVNATIQNAGIAGLSSNDPTNPNSLDVQLAGQDDITNHNLYSTGGLGGPGS